MTRAEFEQLYRTHGRRLFGLAWQLTSNGTDAEDAVQETFLRALRGLGGYEERARAGAWLDRILVNVVRERGRRHTHYRRRVEPDLRALAPPEADPAPGPDRVLEQTDRLRAVRVGLAGIPPTFREVLVLRHFEELSNVETARELGIEASAASKRYLRALRRLGGALGAARESEA